MPGNNRGFLGNVGGRAVDRIAWGNNRDPNNGRVILKPGQLAGGLISRGINLVVPGLGTAINHIGNKIYSNRQPGWPVMESIGMPEPMQITTVGTSKPDTRSGTVGPATQNLGLGNAGPQGMTQGQLYRDPYMGWQQYMAPQGSVGNFGNNDIRTQPPQGTWQPKSGWGRDMMAGGNAGMAGRSLGNTHFSSGRGGAQVADAGAAGDIAAWMGGGSRNTTPFARAVK